MVKVVIIEDETDIRENTVEMLELDGFEVYAAENGMKGVKLVETVMPDIIICDVRMPEMNGYDEIKTLKENPKTQDIPFFFFTASAEKAAEERGLGLGAVGYMKKPLHNDILIQNLKDLGIKA